MFQKVREQTLKLTQIFLQGQRVQRIQTRKVIMKENFKNLSSLKHLQ